MALAKLHHQMGNIVQAVTAYNKVLKVCSQFNLLKCQKLFSILWITTKNV